MSRADIGIARIELYRKSAEITRKGEVNGQPRVPAGRTSRCPVCCKNVTCCRFRKHKIVDYERVDSGAKIAAHSIARFDNQRLPKQIERSIDQDRRGRSLSKTLQQAPELWVALFADHVQAHQVARQQESLGQHVRVRLCPAQRIHASTKMGSFEVAAAVLFRN